MVQYDEVFDCYVVTINNVFIRNCETRDAAEMLERVMLKGKRDRTRKQPVTKQYDVDDFASSNLVVDEDGIVLKDALFDLYQSKDGKLHRNAFFRRLKTIVNNTGLLITIQLTDATGARRCYVKGVKIK